jgi:hypothetical protein
VPQSEDAKALRRAVEATSANLVIVFVNVSVSGKRMASFLSAAGQDGPPLAPVYCKKPTGPEVAPPDVRLLTHGDDNEVPYRFAWLFQQVLFVQLDPRVSGNSPAREKWLYGHLARGKVIPHRIVLSCRALENLTAGGGSELTPQFRYYEKLLRGDTSLFIAGGEPVFYSGIYGDLNVVSAGSAAGRSGTLQGVKDKQQSLFALVELRAEQPPAVYAINPASPDQVIDPVKFPARAGNLERRL